MPYQPHRPIRRHRRRRILPLACLTAAATAVLPNRAPAVTTATSYWTTPTTGFWTESARWSPSFSPNNGTPANTNYKVTINPGGSSPFTVTIDTPVTVSSLTVNSPATLNFANGSLSLSDPSTAPALTFLSSSTVTGPGTLSFDGPLAGSITSNSGTVTLSPYITVRTGSASGSLNYVLNQGTLSAQTPGQSLTLTNFSNPTGLLQATNGGTLILAANLTPATLGNFSAQNGGSILLTNNSTARGSTPVTLTNTNHTLTLSPSTGSLTLSNRATLSGGTLASTGSVPLLVSGSGPRYTDPFYTGPGPATLSNVTVSANISVGPRAYLLLSANTLLSSGQTTTLNGSNSVLIPDAQPVAAGPGGASVLFAGSDSYNTVASDYTSTTIGPNITIRTDTQGGTVGNPSYPLLNQGSISAQTPGTTITLSSTSLTNTGTISASNGANLILHPSSLDNSAGTLLATTGGTISIRSNLPSSQLTHFHADADSTVAIEGTSSAPVTLDNTSSTLALSPSTGPLTLKYATLKGGAITGSTGNGLLVTANSTLQDVSLATPIALRDANLTLTGTTSLSPGSSLSLTGTNITGPDLVTASLTGTADITFDAAGTPFILNPSGALTVGPNITVRTGSGSGILGNDPFGLTLQGTVSAQSPGQTLVITGSHWTNTGTLQATNNSTLSLRGSFTTAAIGNLTTSNGGVAAVIGALDNSAATLTPSPSLNLHLGNGGAITGGSIASPTDTPLVVDAGTSTLNSVDLDAPLSIQPNASLTANSVTFRRPVTLSGATLSLTGAWTNLQPIAATNGASLRVGGTLPASLAPLSATDSTVTFTSTVTTDQFNSLSRTRSPARITGTLDNTASSFAPTDSTYPVTLAGTLKGGTLSLPTPGALQILSGATLDAVTLQSPLTLPDNFTLTLANGPTLSNTSLTLSPATSSPAALRFSGTAPLSGTGEIVFDGSAPSSLVTANSSSAINLGPNITLRTGSQGGTVGAATGSGSVTFAGLVSAQTPGKTLTVANRSFTVTPTATLEARNGSTLAFPNFPTGSYGTPYGTWNVYDNSAISFPAATTFTTNYANITLSGPNSSFPALSALSGNLGSLTLTNGRTFTTQSSLTNSGTLTIGPSSALEVHNSLSNSGTLDLAGGSFILDYSYSSPASSIRSSLLAGHIISSTASADPTRPLAVAYIEAKDLLHLTGSQTSTFATLPADATSLLLFLTLPGDANGDGAITPDDYALLDQGCASHGQYWWQGDFNYDGVVDASDYLLIDTTYLSTHPASPDFLSLRASQFGPAYVQELLTSIPEPSVTACLFAGLLLPRRRNAHRTPPNPPAS